MTSLRSRLVRTLLAVLLPIWALLALGAYWSVMNEVDEMYGQQLDDLAASLVPLDIDQIRAIMANRAAAARGDPDGDRDAVLLWDLAGRLQYQSEAAPAVPFKAGAAAGNAKAEDLVWHGVPWRVLRIGQPARGRQLVVLRSLSERGELLVALGAGLALPWLLTVAMTVPLVAWAIRRGLRPLSDAGRQVAARGEPGQSVIDIQGVVDEVVPFVQEINGLLGRLDAALASEKRFAADASHELRTPLAAARAHVEVALGAKGEAERQKALASALTGISRAGQLTEQLLLLARLDHQITVDQTGRSMGHVPAWAEQVDLRAVMQEAAALHGVQALAKGIELSLDQPSGPCEVMAQPVWLGVAIGNVLSNAVKFTPASGRVVVSVARREEAYAIVVHDSGPGVDADRAALLGQRFSRGEHEHPGSGLGLSIASRIMALHGGTLQFDQDGGMRVTLRLPAAKGVKP